MEGGAPNACEKRTGLDKTRTEIYEALKRESQTNFRLEFDTSTMKSADNWPENAVLFTDKA